MATTSHWREEADRVLSLFRYKPAKEPTLEDF